MSKVLVLYYSSYGHIEAMAAAVRRGAPGRRARRSTSKRVPELVSDKVARDFALQGRSGRAGREDRRPRRLRRHHHWQPAPGSDGCRRKWPISWTRPGGLWMRGGVARKRSAGLFTSTATQTWWGRKTTLFSIITNLLHFRHGGRRPGLRPCRSDDP